MLSLSINDYFNHYRNHMISIQNLITVNTYFNSMETTIQAGNLIGSSRNHSMHKNIKNIELYFQRKGNTKAIKEI